MQALFHTGRYFMLLTKVFQKPEKQRIYLEQILVEMEKLGINSIGIVTIISFFMGAVITLQAAYNLENPLIPKYIIGLGTRDSMILEFSSTIVGLIMAGKVGSNIASEIGTMRVSEQIDALEIMGVNSAAYLIFPKIVAGVLINPLLTVISIVIGISGGYIAVGFTGVITTTDFITGLHYWYVPFYVSYSLIKSALFAFIFTSIPAYHGYYAYGGSLEVGKASTTAVVYSSILILFFNLVLTQLLLA